MLIGRLYDIQGSSSIFPFQSGTLRPWNHNPTYRIEPTPIPSDIVSIMSGSRAALPGATDNLAELENLNEQTLLEELKIRFNRDCIYTYVGEILVTVNPFKWIPGIYEPDKMRMYSSVGDKNQLAPHIFAVSDIAFQQMRVGGKDQVFGYDQLFKFLGSDHVCPKLYRMHPVFLSLASSVPFPLSASIVLVIQHPTAMSSALWAC